MSGRRRFLTLFAAFALACCCGLQPTMADSGHARIVRLSVVQGDVRFARDVKGDSLSDSHTTWEQAVLNLPIRQGYAVATDAGRAEVEFENGAMAFLAENTVLEFYDLSSEDGGFTTRLILRQGTAEFYVNPASGDYFSVTGGDFSVQAETRARFRMNNFDDGSSVDVLRGRLTALVNGKEKLLDKNQSLSVHAGDSDSVEVGRIPASDDFDQWVAGRIDSVSTATAAAQQYSNSYNYTSGFGDLYTYGAWFPIAGYGYGWRPYGVGFGWAPFDYGSWYYDPFFGWTFIGLQPWGWLPYHYGGWLFQPGVGWVWSPSGGGGGRGGVGRYRPITGVWVHSNGTIGIVPSHPLDVKGKTPLNLSQGIFNVTPRGVAGQTAVTDATQWKIESKPSRDIMQSQLAEMPAPGRLSRTMAVGAQASGSAIVYDQNEHKFVNANTAQVERTEAKEADAPSTLNEQSRTDETRVPPASTRVTGREGQTAPIARNTAPPRPPSVPRSVVSERTFNSGSSGGSSSRSSGSSSWGGGSKSSSSGARGSSSGGGSSGGGGGRPH